MLAGDTVSNPQSRIFREFLRLQHSFRFAELLLLFFQFYEERWLGDLKSKYVIERVTLVQVLSLFRINKSFRHFFHISETKG